MEDTEEAIMSEFKEALNEAAGTHGYALIALLQLSENMRAHTASSTPEQQVYLGTGDPNDPTSKTYQAWPSMGLADRLARNGPAVRQLGNQWLTHIYHQWDEEYRPRIAALRGCPQQDVIEPLMGDLRRIRNDVIHNKGVASKEWTGKCATLDWFSIGDDMFITNHMIRDVMEYFGLVCTAGDL